MGNGAFPRKIANEFEAVRNSEELAAVEPLPVHSAPPAREQRKGTGNGSTIGASSEALIVRCSTLSRD
jgi:hypothetical protein